MRHILGVSGGKDSVAMWLWAIRTGLDPVAVYSDTGWEWDGHYAHLDMLEQKIGPLYRVRPERDFVETVRHKGMFPSRTRKWCTPELKIAPFKAWLEAFQQQTGEDVTLLLGIRWEESASRASALEREWSKDYDCQVWRPILDWKVEDVIAEHRRAGVPMHPLYHAGTERVGCFPCVNAGKTELRIVGELAPERIALIRQLEAEIGQTMYVEDIRAEKKRNGGTGPSVRPIGIDAVVGWAKTERGGKKLALFYPPSGCAKWGQCEVSKPDDPKAPTP